MSKLLNNPDRNSMYPSTSSLMFICFCIQQLLMAEINHVVYFSESQLLLAKTNEDRTTSRNAIYSVDWIYPYRKACIMKHVYPRILVSSIESMYTE